ncbi:MAG: VacB/RNase II family 3'-5' exoribonuclease, partial [Gammaproteobacteria bacterium]
VAIADVAHYVQQNTPLDTEARKRGTSVYFPGRVVPMLPEVLSNGLCSLNPKVDRLCLACEMTVSEKGKVTRSRFFNAVMRSHRRLTYGESLELLEGRKSAKGVGAVMDVLHHLRDLYHVFLSARRRRGALDFDLPAVKFILNDKGEIASVKPELRHMTHKIIEECMIAANVEAARFLTRHRIAALYRIHEGPKEDKLEELKLFLATFGLKPRAARDLTPKDINHLLNKVAGLPAAELIENVVLRSLTRAVYQPKNLGHFGLALPGYAHFTSPIRRYPDLLVHRAIKWVLKTGSARRYSYSMGEMQGLGENCSRFERRADEAVWDVEEQLKCAYMGDHIGEHYDAVVAGVVGFGLFVRVTELGIDGLVHVTNLPHDYYHFDAATHTLKGERHDRVYQLMDRMRVRLASVNLEDRKIDFELADAEEVVVPKKGAGRRRKRRRG